jgi:general secretion pathway protein A
LPRRWSHGGRPAAQSLSDELLEEVRLLANIETDTEKLLPVILAGQPELADRLDKPSLRQLKQRVALRCELRPLTHPETAAYIGERIRKAGGDSARLFTREAVTLIHERSAGIPRVISVICDNALVTGFAMNTRPVTRDIVLDVTKDFHIGASANRRSAITETRPAEQAAPPVVAAAKPAERVAVEPAPRRYFSFS